MSISTVLPTLDEQPPMLRHMSAWLGIATSNGNLRLQEIGATRELADAFVDERNPVELPMLEQNMAQLPNAPE